MFTICYAYTRNYLHNVAGPSMGVRTLEIVNPEKCNKIVILFYEVRTVH